jgi:uncharacterized membrane protein YfcA
MTITTLIILIIVFFLTSAIGVVTGSNSLIAVPAMFQAGVEAKTAVATNMFGLTFMAIGAAIPFVRERRVDYKAVSPMVGLTLVASCIGAMLVGVISTDGLKFIVSAAMILVSAFTLLRSDSKPEAEHPRTRATLILAYILVFALGIYGGLFSGGYVTILTAVCVSVYGMSFGEAVASTKVINVFSSAVATAVFMWQGLVDYKLGLILGVTMFVGGYIGAIYATRLSEVWLRRIFIGAVLLLAAKTIYDLIIRFN